MEPSPQKKKDPLASLFSKLDTALQEKASPKEEPPKLPEPPPVEEPPKKKDPFASIFKQLDAAMPVQTPAPEKPSEPEPEPFALTLKKHEPEKKDEPEKAREEKKIEDANDDFLAGFRKFKK